MAKIKKFETNLLVLDAVRIKATLVGLFSCLEDTDLPSEKRADFVYKQLSSVISQCDALMISCSRYREYIKEYMTDNLPF